MMRLNNESGMAVFIALLFSVIISYLAVTMVNMNYQQTRLLNKSGSEKLKNYYKAEAGLNDAFWRIRNNRTLAGWSSDFKDPAFGVTYYIDIDSDKISSSRKPDFDVQVTVSPRNTTAGTIGYRQREVHAIGLDS